MEALAPSKLRIERKLPRGSTQHPRIATSPDSDVKTQVEKGLWSRADRLGQPSYHLIKTPSLSTLIAAVPLVIVRLPQSTWTT